MAEIISKNVGVGPCTVHCLKSKNTRGQDIVLLHAARFQAETWKKLATLNRLADAGYRPYAIDLPGYGKSQECTVAHETILQGFIQQEELSQPVLVGPSMSGKISLHFALRQPESVGGLVLIGAVGVSEKSYQLDTIRVPCLILWGGADTIAPLDDAHLLHEKIQGAEMLIFDKAGHPCYVHQPDLWHQELLGFLHKNFS